MNYKKLQAITATFIIAKEFYCKILLDFCKLFKNYTSAIIALFIFKTLKNYKIKKRLKYIIANNYEVNNTFYKAIANKLVYWQLIKR